MTVELPYQVFYPLGLRASSLSLARGVITAAILLIYGPIVNGGWNAFPQALVHAGAWLALSILLAAAFSQWQIEAKGEVIKWGLPGFRSQCLKADITHVTETHLLLGSFILHTSRGPLKMSVLNCETHRKVREYFWNQRRSSIEGHIGAIPQNFSPLLLLLMLLIFTGASALGAKAMGLSLLDLRLYSAGLTVYSPYLMIWLLESWRPKIVFSEDSICYVRDLFVPEKILLGQVDSALVTRAAAGPMVGQVYSLVLKSGSKRFELPASLPSFQETAESLLKQLPSRAVIKDE